jgi:putative ABC transport system permease protein
VQRLSTVLLLLLMVFIVLGAANALVLTTAGRHAELVLLHRTGTTRRQLRRMLLVESLLTGVLAWLIGTLAVVPAVLGVSAGLLPGQVPVVDLTAYVFLSLVVLATAIGATNATATWAVRRATGQARPNGDGHGLAGTRGPAARSSRRETAVAGRSHRTP